MLSPDSLQAIFSWPCCGSWTSSCAARRPTFQSRDSAKKCFAALSCFPCVFPLLLLVQALLHWCNVFFSLAEDPNAVVLQQERLPPQQLADFRSRWTVREKYKVAANLWSKGGLPFDEALRIASQAFSSWIVSLLKQICFNKALSHFGLAVKRPKFDGILVGGNHKSMGSRWCFKIQPELLQPGADPHYCKPSVLWLNPTGILGNLGASL